MKKFASKLLVLGFSLLFTFFYVVIYHYTISSRNKIKTNVSIETKDLKKTYTPLLGDSICNRFLGYKVADKVFFGNCEFRNICLNEKGEWILFSPFTWMPDSWVSQLRTVPWIFAKGRDYTCGGLVRARHEKGLIKKQGEEYILSADGGFEFSPRFTWFDTPAYMAYRFGVGSLKHGIQENLNMLIHLMFVRNNLTLNNHVLFLDDIYDKSIQCLDDALTGYSSEVSEKRSSELFSLISNNPLRQVCRNENGHFIASAPCRNVMSGTQQDEKKIVACFSSLSGGFSMNDYRVNRGREIISVMLKNLVYEKLDISPHENYKDKEYMLVVIPESEYIENVDLMVKGLRQAFSKINSALTKKIRVKTVDLKTMKLSEQIKLFSEVDVTILDEETIYLSIFMRQSSFSILIPNCHVEGLKKKSCQNDEFFLFSHLTTTVIDYLDLIDRTEEIDCAPKNPAYVIKQRCELNLKVAAVANQILKLLKSKYKENFAQTKSKPNLNAEYFKSLQ